jgi:hypothetical protein
MSIKDVLNKKSKFLSDGGIIAIDVKELNKGEIDFLRGCGYRVELFNQRWIRSPYYAILKG